MVRHDTGAARIVFVSVRVSEGVCVGCVCVAGGVSWYAADAGCLAGCRERCLCAVQRLMTYDL